jgi:hypothetical protein
LALENAGNLLNGPDRFLSASQVMEDAVEKPVRSAQFEVLSGAYGS